MAVHFRTHVPSVIRSAGSIITPSSAPLWRQLVIAQAGRTTVRLSHRRVRDEHWTNIIAAGPVSPKSVSAMELIKYNVAVSRPREGTFGAIPTER